MGDDHDQEQAARERDHDRTDGVRAILDAFEADRKAGKYPVRREELTEWYTTQVAALPNETEALGDAIDRLANDDYPTRAALEEELTNRLTGIEMGEQEYNDERDLREIAEAVAGSGAIESS